MTKSVDISDTAFEEGRTSYASVLEAIGPPDFLTSLPGGMAFIYEDILITERQLNFKLAFGKVLQWFKLSGGRGKAKRKTLLLTFDEKGSLLSQSYQYRVENLGMGASVQFLYFVHGVVDVEDFKEILPQHEWGMMALMPLTETLNMNQSLRTGASGLEQLGTPESIGQHSPEHPKREKGKR